LYRALIHHWRVNLAVLLGAAVATAVLTGALLVGDSVRGSLRELTLDRLGLIDSALVTQRFFDAGLADRLAEFESADPPLGPVAPAIVVRGAAVQPDTGARAAGIAIHGIDERFASLFDQRLDLEPAADQIFPSVVINETLRKELAAEVGDSLVLSFGRQAEVPRDTLMGETSREDVVGSLRLTVTAVLPDAGMGRFGLAPAQQNPANAFVALDRLQRTLGFPDEVNALFAVHRRADADPGAALAATVGLEELGLTVREAEGHFVLESREFVLRPNLVETLRSVTGRMNAPFLSTQSYLANQMRLGDRVLPYSMVAALTPDPAHPWSALTLQGGGPIRAISREGILLNRWAADDLQAAVGDDIVVEYFVVGDPCLGRAGAGPEPDPGLPRCPRRGRHGGLGPAVSRRPGSDSSQGRGLLGSVPRHAEGLRLRRDRARALEYALRQRDRRENRRSARTGRGPDAGRGPEGAPHGVAAFRLRPAVPGGQA